MIGAREWACRSSAHEEFASPPLQKIPLQKSSAFEFLNLHLQNKEVQEILAMPWSALRAARANVRESDASFIRATLYDQVRTFFQHEN